MIISFQTRQRLRLFSPALTTIIVVLILMGIAYYVYTLYEKEQVKVQQLSQNIERLSKQIQTIQRNKQALQDNIDTYSVTMSRLIPSEEDYFSIIFALEEISQKTGFIISDYTINVSNDTDKKKKDRISLNVKGSGRQDDFLAFLKQYNFAGGRLVTIEHVDFNNSSNTETQLVLNFYTKEVKAQPQDEEVVLQGGILREAFASEDGAPVVSDDDIALIEEIEQSIDTPSIGNTDGNENQDYPTKTSPFE